MSITPKFTMVNADFRLKSFYEFRELKAYFNLKSVLFMNTLIYGI